MEKKFEIGEILIAVEKILNNDFKKLIHTKNENDKILEETVLPKDTEKIILLAEEYLKKS
jgi:hypothetical protein